MKCLIGLQANLTWTKYYETITSAYNKDVKAQVKFKVQVIVKQ